MLSRGSTDPFWPFRSAQVEFLKLLLSYWQRNVWKNDERDWDSFIGGRRRLASEGGQSSGHWSLTCFQCEVLLQKLGIVSHFIFSTEVYKPVFSKEYSSHAYVDVDMWNIDRFPLSDHLRKQMARTNSTVPHVFFRILWENHPHQTLKQDEGENEK